MTHETRSTAALGGAVLLTAAVMCGTASAREPGVLPTVPTGASVGVPIAAPAPVNGIAVSSRSGVAFFDYYDGNGNKTGTELTIRDTVLQLAIIPGVNLLGGQYRAFLSAPLIDLEGDRIATPFGPMDSSRTALGSVEIRPMDISWTLSPGIFVNAGASVFTPGDWDSQSLVNPAQNFWTISPSAGFSYLRDGWNASAHLMYFANFENEDNGYTSGDELQLNLTLMKDIGHEWSIGGVGYWREQITEDKNPRGAYFGTNGGKASQTGLGVSVTKQIGPVNLNAMYTRDISVKNSGGGDRLWFNAIIPLVAFGR